MATRISTVKEYFDTLNQRFVKDAAKGGPSGDVVKALAQMAEGILV